MNARIFELAKQTDLIQWDTLPSGARTPDHESVVKAQKFAELIVTDVLDILTTYRTRVIFDDGFEYNCDHPINAISKHFGVEE